MNTKPLDLAQFEGHTPGPWATNRPMKMDEAGLPISGDTYAYMEGGHLVATIGAYKRTPKEVAVNGRLIAAAPALLAECRRLQAENERLREALSKLIPIAAQFNAATGAWNKQLDQARDALKVSA